MPVRRRNRRKRPVRRNVRRRFHRRRRVPRALRPRTYNFTRQFVENIQLNPSSPPTGWSFVGNGMVRSMEFSLAQLPNYTEFTSLFAQYRILAVKQEYYFTDTASVNIENTSGYNNTGGKQILMYINPNAIGSANASSLTEDFFMQSQCAKKRLCLRASGRPVKIYTKLKQLSQIYSNEVLNTDYVKIRPKFISTNEVNAEHYGLDMRLERVDGNEFSHGGDEYPHVKIITKLYLQCRQVQ